jgi:hypothetical protein
LAGAKTWLPPPPTLQKDMRLSTLRAAVGVFAVASVLFTLTQWNQLLGAADSGSIVTSPITTSYPKWSQQQVVPLFSPHRTDDLHHHGHAESDVVASFSSCSSAELHRKRAEEKRRDEATSSPSAALLNSSNTKKKRSKGDSANLAVRLERDFGSGARDFLANICNLQFDRKNLIPHLLSERRELRSALRRIRKSDLFREWILGSASKNLENRSNNCLVVDPPLDGKANDSGIFDWRQAVRSLPTLEPPSFPSNQSSSMKTSLIRAPRHASWVTINNVCATCESQSSRRQFFMNPLHSCHLTLWAVGTPDAHSIRKLVSQSRRYRNAIFKEREGAFQYGGSWGPIRCSDQINNKSNEHDEDDVSGGADATSRARSRTQSAVLSNCTAAGRYLDEKDETHFDISGYVAGTTTLVPSFHVDNVGHVIHDALWALQLTLMFLTGELNSTGGASPGTALFSHEFEEVSSDFFGFFSTLQTIRAVNRASSPARALRSPFSSLPWRRGAICFERLVVGGQDRHVDGGGSGLRHVVARSIRREVFSLLDASTAVRYQSKSDDVQIFFYGRNDMHRRSIDNPHMLIEAISAVTDKMGLPPVRVISTFGISPARQVLLAREMDFFLTIQGAHLQHSLFMPHDGVIFEIAPCRSEGVSFLRRYGRYMESQTHVFFPLCDDVIINFSEEADKIPDQNLTLCQEHVMEISNRVQVLLERLLDLRRRGSGE